MNKALGQDSLISTIVSIAAPLIQILAVLSISLSDQLKLAEFFAKSEYLPLVNFLIIFIVISIIGVLVTRRNNLGPGLYNSPGILKTLIYKIFRKKEPVGNYKYEYMQQIVLMSRMLWLGQIPAFILFLASILIPLSYLSSEYLALVQYLFYGIFVVSSGIITFLWLQYYQQFKNQIKPQDFYPNLLDSMRKQGVIEESKIIKYNQISLINLNQVVRIQVGNIVYIMITDYAGKIIFNIWTEDKVPNNIKELLDNDENYIPSNN